MTSVSVDVTAVVSNDASAPLSPAQQDELFALLMQRMHQQQQSATRPSTAAAESFSSVATAAALPGSGSHSTASHTASALSHAASNAVATAITATATAATATNVSGRSKWSVPPPSADSSASVALGKAADARIIEHETWMNLLAAPHVRARMYESATVIENTTNEASTSSSLSSSSSTQVDSSTRALRALLPPHALLAASRGIYPTSTTQGGVGGGGSSTTPWNRGQGGTQPALGLRDAVDRSIDLAQIERQDTVLRRMDRERIEGRRKQKKNGTIATNETYAMNEDHATTNVHAANSNVLPSAGFPTVAASSSSSSSSSSTPQVDSLLRSSFFTSHYTHRFEDDSLPLTHKLTLDKCRNMEAYKKDCQRQIAASKLLQQQGTIWSSAQEAATTARSTALKLYHFNDEASDEEDEEGESGHKFLARMRAEIEAEVRAQEQKDKDQEQKQEQNEHTINNDRRTTPAPFSSAHTSTTHQPLQPPQARSATTILHPVRPSTSPLVSSAVLLSALSSRGRGKKFRNSGGSLLPDSHPPPNPAVLKELTKLRAQVVREERRFGKPVLDPTTIVPISDASSTALVAVEKEEKLLRSSTAAASSLTTTPATAGVGGGGSVAVRSSTAGSSGINGPFSKHSPYSAALANWMCSHGKLRKQVVEESQVRRCADMFSLLDANNDGLIELAEMERALLQLGVHVDLHKLKASLKGFDSDSDGTITFEEFLHGFSSIATWDSHLVQVFSDRAALQKREDQLRQEAQMWSKASRRTQKAIRRAKTSASATIEQTSIDRPIGHQREEIKQQRKIKREHEMEKGEERKEQEKQPQTHAVIVEQQHAHHDDKESLSASPPSEIQHSATHSFSSLIEEKEEEEDTEAEEDHSHHHHPHHHPHHDPPHLHHHHQFQQPEPSSHGHTSSSRAHSRRPSTTATTAAGGTDSIDGTHSTSSVSSTTLHFGSASHHPSATDMHTSSLPLSKAPSALSFSSTHSISDSTTAVTAAAAAVGTTSTHQLTLAKDSIVSSSSLPLPPPPSGRSSSPSKKSSSSDTPTLPPSFFAALQLQQNAGVVVTPLAAVGAAAGLDLTERHHVASLRARTAQRNAAAEAKFLELSAARVEASLAATALNDEYNHRISSSSPKRNRSKHPHHHGHGVSHHRHKHTHHAEVPHARALPSEVVAMLGLPDMNTRKESLRARLRASSPQRLHAHAAIILQQQQQQQQQASSTAKDVSIEDSVAIAGGALATISEVVNTESDAVAGTPVIKSKKVSTGPVIASMTPGIILASAGGAGGAPPPVSAHAELPFFLWTAAFQRHTKLRTLIDSHMSEQEADMREQALQIEETRREVEENFAAAAMAKMLEDAQAEVAVVAAGTTETAPPPSVTRVTSVTASRNGAAIARSSNHKREASGSLSQPQQPMPLIMEEWKQREQGLMEENKSSDPFPMPSTSASGLIPRLSIAQQILLKESRGEVGSIAAIAGSASARNYHDATPAAGKKRWGQHLRPQSQQRPSTGASISSVDSIAPSSVADIHQVPRPPSSSISSSSSLLRVAQPVDHRPRTALSLFASMQNAAESSSIRARQSAAAAAATAAAIASTSSDHPILTPRTLQLVALSTTATDEEIATFAAAAEGEGKNVSATTTRSNPIKASTLAVPGTTASPPPPTSATMRLSPTSSTAMIASPATTVTVASGPRHMPRRSMHMRTSSSATLNTGAGASSSNSSSSSSIIHAAPTHAPTHGHGHNAHRAVSGSNTGSSTGPPVTDLSAVSYFPLVQENFGGYIVRPTHRSRLSMASSMSMSMTNGVMSGAANGGEGGENNNSSHNRVRERRGSISFNNVRSGVHHPSVSSMGGGGGGGLATALRSSMPTPSLSASASTSSSSPPSPLHQPTMLVSITLASSLASSLNTSTSSSVTASPTSSPPLSLTQSPASSSPPTSRRGTATRRAIQRRRGLSSDAAAANSSEEGLLLELTPTIPEMDNNSSSGGAGGELDLAAVVNSKTTDMASSSITTPRSRRHLSFSTAPSSFAPSPPLPHPLPPSAHEPIMLRSQRLNRSSVRLTTDQPHSLRNLSSMWSAVLEEGSQQLQPVAETD